MYKKILALLLAGTLAVGVTACSGEVKTGNATGVASSQAEPETPQSVPAEDTASSREEREGPAQQPMDKEYTWDINGDMPMHWETSDQYQGYVEIASQACPIGEEGDTPLVSMKSIFPKWEGWPMDAYTGTNIVPWHFDAGPELGEEAKENKESFTIWGNLQDPKNALTGDVSTVEDDLSFFLTYFATSRDVLKLENIATTGLRTKEVNGHVVKYVRMQGEYDRYISKDKTIRQCVQRTAAIVPIETSNGDVYHLEVQIDEFRTDGTALSDDSIIDLIFENVVY